MSKKYTPNLTVNKTEFVLVTHDNDINDDSFISIDNGILTMKRYWKGD